jgi:CubicO group peptidase (beta-lactamase class C family)
MRISRRVFLGTCAAACAAPMVARAAGVEDLAAGFLKDWNAPGLSVAFLMRGKLRLVQGFGHADPARQEALTPDHRFRIASLSKPLTAAAVLALAAGGRLDPDHRVFAEGGLLRGFLPPAPPRPDWLEAVTVDHLLSHRAGGWGNDWRDPMFIDPAVPQAELIRRTLAGEPLQNEPGAGFAYSNFGYCLLGRVIEAVTGVGYDAFLQQNLFAPAGAAGFALGGSRLQDRLPREVIYGGAEDPYGMNLPRMDSHGGWIATPQDMVAVFARMDGDKTLRDVVAPEVPRRLAKPGEPGGGYGRGLALNPAHGNRWHTGSLPGVTTIAVMIEGGGVFAGFTNARAEGIDGALDGLMWQMHDRLI